LSLCVARPSTSLASSSAPSVRSPTTPSTKLRRERQTHCGGLEAMVDAGWCQNSAHNVSCPWDASRKHGRILTDITHSEVLCLHAQADPLQPHPWWYVFLDGHNPSIMTKGLADLIRTLPLPRSLQDVLANRPRHDSPQDRPR
jgi:hypothetical protein